jgi:CheY-like chemotaxis protein
VVANVRSLLEASDPHACDWLDEAETPPSPRPAGPPRVLVVDDDPVVLGAMREALTALGSEAFTAMGGTAALELVATQSLDLVLSDLGMPEMSGWQVAEQVKRLSPATRVLLLTGWGDAVVPNRCVDGLLTKPVRLAHLQEILGQVSTSA